jgi:hypothetical protein
MTRLCFFLILASLAGCSEVRDENDTGVPGTDAPVADTGVPGTDAPAIDAPASDTSGTDAPSDDDAPAPASALVVNEIFADGQDFVELVNAGATAFSLDGMSIVDGDDAHVPVAFPAGTSVAPGARYLVGFEHPCADAPPAGLGLTERCIETDFGIGNSGDTVRILEGTEVTGTVVLSAAFPGAEPAGLTAGQSYCRLPDVTGDFAPCTPTADATNEGP